MNKRPFSFVIVVIIILVGVLGTYASPLPPQAERVNAPALNPVQVERPFSPSTPAIIGQTSAPTTEWTLHKTADGVHPDGNEQEMMWLMNRARANPTAEGIWLATSTEPDITGGRDYFNVNVAILQSEFASYSVKPPAAFDQRLYNAAKAHSDDLIVRDAQDHTGQFQRITDAGFSYTSGRGSVFSYARNPLYAHAAFNIDWGGSDGTGMQTGRGHRMAIMSADGDYTNVGIAMVADNNPNNNVGPLVTTGNYVGANTGQSNHYNRFIVGTVWEDLDGNGRYDAGEGRGGVTVMPNNGTYYAITGDSGGYAIPVDAGSYQVSFSGGGIATAQHAVTVGVDSALLDHMADDAPPVRYSIGGRVTVGGNGLSGVTMRMNTGETAVSDSNGDYTFTDLITDTYTITPELSGYTFAPTSATIAVPPSAANADFVATVIPTYELAGRVRLGNGTGVATVQMETDGGQTAVTNSNGDYTFANLLAGSYTITPELNGYTFAPTSATITVPPSDADVDFVATVIPTYELSGRVERLDNGAGISGLQMETDGGQTAVTDSNGDYTFTNLPAGSYTITPRAAGYVYTPASVTGTVPPDGTVATIQATVSSVYLPIILNPLESIDLAVTGLEVTQVVQRTDNSVPLVANKETAVRVYAQQLEGDTVNDAVVRLTAVRNNSTIGTLSSSPMTLPNTPNRVNFDSTVNFELPANWLNGTVQLTAAIVHSGNDDNPSNDSQSYTMNFNNVPALDIKIIPINYTHQGSTNPGYYPGSNVDYISDWIERAYPVGDVNISYRAPHNFTGNLDNGASWEQLLDEISSLKNSDGASYSTLYYAFIPTGNGGTYWFQSGIAGLGWIGWRAAIGLDLGDGDGSGTLAGHEIGHNLGRYHAPGCGTSGVDGNYPYLEGDIGQYGLDVRNWLFKTPATDYDIMSYCHPEWMSDYTYSALYADQMAYGRPALAATQESVLVRVNLSSGDVVLQPTYELNSVPSALPINSSYAVELLDSDGAVLVTYPVMLLEAEEEGVHALSIHAVVPTDEAMASIRIIHDGVQIAERVMSEQNRAAQTAVSLTETTTAITLQWGDPTTPTIIRYTADDGATWQTVALDQVGGQFVVEKGDWLGENGRFELIFADGGETAVLQR